MRKYTMHIRKLGNVSYFNVRKVLTLLLILVVKRGQLASAPWDCTQFCHLPQKFSRFNMCLLLLL